MIKHILLAAACCLPLAGTAFASVDVNSADEAALNDVKGIGPAMARRIVEERGKQGAFKDAEDLAHRVKGLGPKSIAHLQEEGLVIGRAGTASAGRKDGKDGKGVKSAAGPVEVRGGKAGGADRHAAKPAQ
ncbi:helix-hairpin-helix domain-containing protein [Cupriavidus respiraculi]|uniref:ComEA family DNA-binding protein n=1 Tax=Cupriavidus respiraculi TaxID=195930 RepID=UPI001C987F81|nr:helix-hairpin-helix domain-containing protein [Cupriavidus respiraculi]MBY4945777.1 helix-hairpin-helix domain-containing protein [Cupriavidus respiraculi]